MALPLAIGCGQVFWMGVLIFNLWWHLVGLELKKVWLSSLAFGRIIILLCWWCCGSTFHFIASTQFLRVSFIGSDCYINIAIKLIFCHVICLQEGTFETTGSDRRHTSSTSTLHCSSPLHLWQITAGTPLYRQTGYLFIYLLKAYCPVNRTGSS